MVSDPDGDGEIPGADITCMIHGTALIMQVVFMTHGSVVLAHLTTVAGDGEIPTTMATIADFTMAIIVVYTTTTEIILEETMWWVQEAVLVVDSFPIVQEQTLPHEIM